MTADGNHSHIAFQKDLFEELIQRMAAEQDDPVSREIWRVRWGSTVQLVVILDVSTESVVASPLSYDVALGDNHAVQVSPLNQTLGYEVIAWTSLERQLPIFVLDVVLGKVDDDGLLAIRSQVGSGASITNALDERCQVHDAIEERMEVLAQARWLPASIQVRNLASVMRERLVVPSDISKALGIEPGTATAIVRGERGVTPEQAGRLAPLLGVTEDDLLAPAAINPQLVHELDRPVFRQRLWEKGRQEGATDEATWKYHVASTQLALAARTTDRATERDRWRGLIEEYLRGS